MQRSSETPESGAEPTPEEALRRSAQRVFERHHPFITDVGRAACAYCHEVWPCPSALSAQHAVALSGGPDLELPEVPEVAQPASRPNPPAPAQDLPPEPAALPYEPADLPYEPVVAAPRLEVVPQPARLEVVPAPVWLEVVPEPVWLEVVSEPLRLRAVRDADTESVVYAAVAQPPRLEAVPAPRVPAPRAAVPAARATVRVPRPRTESE